ncbi:MAG: sulfotransferase family 2 domain-containing protein [Bacteroidota bacterium]
MICFKKKGEDIYLVTNYKVMFSTMSRQESLEVIPKTRRMISILLKHKLGLQKSTFYLLVRNPYNRVESFFRDKFRQAIAVNKEEGSWQLCQKMFFPLMEIQESMSAETIGDKFLSTSFAEFVSMLPEVHMKDGHLFPQHWAHRVNARTNVLPVSFPFTAVFRMESKTDMEKLATIFGVDIKVRANSTKAVKADIHWGEQEIRTVDQVYAKDFVSFGYDKKLKP